MMENLKNFAKFSGTKPTLNVDGPWVGLQRKLVALCTLAYILKKNLLFHLQLSPKSVFSPSTSKPNKSPPSTFRTVHFTYTVNGGMLQ
jgi:hypothetical protein